MYFSNNFKADLENNIHGSNKMRRFPASNECAMEVIKVHKTLTAHVRL